MNIRIRTFIRMSICISMSIIVRAFISMSIMFVPFVDTISSLLFEITSVTLSKLSSNVSKTTIFLLACVTMSMDPRARLLR